MTRPATATILAVLCGVWLAVPAAAQPAAVPGGVASILEGFPADTPAKRDALCAEILKLGAPAIEDAMARVLPPGQGDDSKARFAVNGLAVHVTRPGAERERAVFARSLLASLGKTRDPGVATFLISQVQVAGKSESVRPLEKYLADPALAGPASAALVTIGGKDASKALVNALAKAPASVRPALADALGEMRSPDALKALLPLADSPDEATRRAALYALANTGDPAAGPVLARARLAASPRERAQAPSLYLLHARRLVEAGRTAEGTDAARSILASYQQPGEVQHASTALSLVVSALGPKALPDLLAAAASPDRSLRGAALALAGKIPGPEATAQWIEKARTASPEARAGIVAMLGSRGDATALPFVRESLDSRDEAVRLAAIPAAARLGGDAVLPDLLRQVPAASESEVAALRTALLGTRADLVVPEAEKLLGSTPLPGKALLVEVLAAKGARDKVDLPALIAMLETAEGENAARLQEAVAATVRANPDAEHRTDAILELLKNATPPEKAATLGVLPKVGGTKALKAVVEETASPDISVQRAAVMALSQWPDYTAVEDLRRIGSTTPDREQRVRAFEGFVRLMDGSRLPAQRRLSAFQDLLSAPGEDADRRLLLAGVAGVREPESLRLLAGTLDNPVLARRGGRGPAGARLPPDVAGTLALGPRGLHGPPARRGIPHRPRGEGAGPRDPPRPAATGRLRPAVRRPLPRRLEGPRGRPGEAREDDAGGAGPGPGGGRPEDARPLARRRRRARVRRQGRQPLHRSATTATSRCSSTGRSARTATAASTSAARRRCRSGTPGRTRSAPAASSTTRRVPRSP